MQGVVHVNLATPHNGPGSGPEKIYANLPNIEIAPRRVSHLGVPQVSLRVEEGCGPAELEQPSRPLGLPRLLRPSFPERARPGGGVGAPAPVVPITADHDVALKRCSVPGLEEDPYQMLRCIGEP